MRSFNESCHALLYFVSYTLNENGKLWFIEILHMLCPSTCGTGGCGYDHQPRHFKNRKKRRPVDLVL